MIALTAASAVYSYLPGANLVRASAQLRSRPALLIAPIDAPVDGAATVETVSDIADMEGVVKPNSSRTGLVSKQAALNRQLSQAESSDEVLQLVEQNAAELNAVNVATALHRIASRNKVKRARRDAVLMDRRFQLLITALEVHAADGMSNEPRSVADVLWSFGTMKHWPPSLLKPMLMSVLGHLEKGTFEAQHLSTVVWAFAKLETKPVRLLEQIEAQATELVAKLTMQNIANLMWGFAKLNYAPARLLPTLAPALASSGLCDTAKPVEVADITYALAYGASSAPGEHSELLAALAARASPGAALDDFSSRQLVTMVTAFAKLEATAALPEGVLDAWLAAVRAQHEAKPLLAADARALEAALERLGIDGGWVKRGEMLNILIDLANDPAAGAASARGVSYSEDELRAVFDAIDTDGSGDIDLGELRAAITQVSPTADEDTIAKMLTMADADGSGEVDFDEFKKLFGVVPVVAA